MWSLGRYWVLLPKRELNQDQNQMNSVESNYLEESMKVLAIMLWSLLVVMFVSKRSNIQKIVLFMDWLKEIICGPFMYKPERATAVYVSCVVIFMVSNDSLSLKMFACEYLLFMISLVNRLNARDRNQEVVNENVLLVNHVFIR
jgi:cytochrome c oxidase subunit IV